MFDKTLFPKNWTHDHGKESKHKNGSFLGVELYKTNKHTNNGHCGFWFVYKNVDSVLGDSVNQCWCVFTYQCIVLEQWGWTLGVCQPGNGGITHWPLESSPSQVPQLIPSTQLLISRELMLECLSQHMVLYWSGLYLNDKRGYVLLKVGGSVQPDLKSASG